MGLIIGTIDGKRMLIWAGLSPIAHIELIDSDLAISLGEMALSNGVSYYGIGVLEEQLNAIEKDLRDKLVELAKRNKFYLISMGDKGAKVLVKGSRYPS